MPSSSSSVGVLGDLGAHQAPAVPEEQLVLETMRDLHHDVRPDEPLAANNGDVDVHSERLDVEPPRAMTLPDLGGRAKRRVRAGRDVERVEREVTRLELGIEAHPAAVLPRLDDTWSWFQSGLK